MDNAIIQRNYQQIKQEVQDIIEAELQKKLNDPARENIIKKVTLCRQISFYINKGRWNSNVFYPSKNRNFWKNNKALYIHEILAFLKLLANFKKPLTRLFGNNWWSECPRKESNLHFLAKTRFWVWRVYQFRHMGLKRSAIIRCCVNSAKHIIDNISFLEKIYSG